jgi:glutaminyl-tRNA synthetase
VKATLHWVSAADAIPAEIRLYNPLFTRSNPSGSDIAADLNPNAMEVLADCKLEPALATAELGVPIQFERQGYFCLDPDTTTGHPVLNRTIGLRDTWAKERSG